MTKPLPRTDETLYPYRGHIGFKKYNPQKPAKYGLLYRSLCDSTVTYTYFSLAYAGKPEVVGGNGAKFYITGTDEYTKYLVNGLSVTLPFKGATFRWTATSRRFFWLNGHCRRSLQLLVPCAMTEKAFQRR